MAEYVAECFWPGVTEADLGDLDARARESVEGDVRYVGSLLMREDEVVLCFFVAGSLEAAKDAATQAAIPFERVIETVRIGCD